MFTVSSERAKEVLDHAHAFVMEVKRQIKEEAYT
jgi:hypothetical protein